MKQLELHLQTTPNREQRRYLQKVRIHTLTHFLGENHPDTLAAKRKRKA